MSSVESDLRRRLFSIDLSEASQKKASLSLWEEWYDLQHSLFALYRLNREYEKRQRRLRFRYLTRSRRVDGVMRRYLSERLKNFEGTRDQKTPHAQGSDAGEALERHVSRYERELGRFYRRPGLLRFLTRPFTALTRKRRLVISYYFLKRVDKNQSKASKRNYFNKKSRQELLRLLRNRSRKREEHKMLLRDFALTRWMARKGSGSEKADGLRAEEKDAVNRNDLSGRENTEGLLSWLEIEIKNLLGIESKEERLLRNQLERHFKVYQDGLLKQLMEGKHLLERDVLEEGEESYLNSLKSSYEVTRSNLSIELENMVVQETSVLSSESLKRLRDWNHSSLRILDQWHREKVEELNSDMAKKGVGLLRERGSTGLVARRLSTDELEVKTEVIGVRLGERGEGKKSAENDASNEDLLIAEVDAEGETAERKDDVSTRGNNNASESRRGREKNQSLIVSLEDLQKLFYESLKELKTKFLGSTESRVFGVDLSVILRSFERRMKELELKEGEAIRSLDPDDQRLYEKQKGLLKVELDLLESLRKSHEVLKREFRGRPNEASKAKIKKLYREFQTKLHPDRHGEKETIIRSYLTLFLTVLNNIKQEEETGERELSLVDFSERIEQLEKGVEELNDLNAKLFAALKQHQCTLDEMKEMVREHVAYVNATLDEVRGVADEVRGVLGETGRVTLELQESKKKQQEIRQNAIQLSAQMQETWETLRSMRETQQSQAEELRRLEATQASTNDSKEASASVGGQGSVSPRMFGGH